jgi:hypothetical protein
MSNELLNDKHEKEKFTIEKLKIFEGFENISDNEANEILKSYDAFSSIIYDCFQKEILKTR